MNGIVLIARYIVKILQIAINFTLFSFHDSISFLEKVDGGDMK